MYNDHVICNASGLNKASTGFKGYYSDEDSLLNSPGNVSPDSKLIAIKDNEPRVFPNPTEDEIHVQLQSNNGCEFTIYDMQGRIVKKVILQGVVTEFTTNISELSIGIYGYKLLYNEQLSTGTISKN